MYILIGIFESTDAGGIAAQVLGHQVRSSLVCYLVLVEVVKGFWCQSHGSGVYTEAGDSCTPREVVFLLADPRSGVACGELVDNYGRKVFF